ncbi:MAG: glutamate--tRNA ligase [Myxococcota bacterium]
MPVTTRFAPSPTGHLHIGGARTALYNWALARDDGRFLLRVEDTDAARSSEEAAAGILEDLLWLGIVWSEGPVAEGAGGDPREIGPFRQAERLSLYRKAVDRLIAEGRAYPAFETPEELDALRRQAREEKRNFRYRCAADFDRDAALARAASEPHVVRFRMPETPLRVVDEILGEIEFGEEHLDDFVIWKRDGFPTYHLAVVVDDEAMGITHVLRGQEHLNNTPRHAALQEALGYRAPVYAHLPVIFNADGSKMSKRDKDKAARAAVRQALKEDSARKADFEALVPEATAPKGLDGWLKDKRSQLPTDLLDGLALDLGLALPCIEVEDFRRAGFLPDVLCNYLALLGWSPGEKDDEGKDLERFDRAFLQARFALDRVGVSNARFDMDKLLAFNQQTIAEQDDADFLAAWRDWASRYAVADAARDSDWLTRFAAMIRSRCRTLADVSRRDGPGGFAWVDDDAYAFDAKAVEKWLRKGEPDGFTRLEAAGAALATLEDWASEAIEARMETLAEELGVGLGKLAQPLRVAVTGSASSPPLGDTLAALGPEAVARRIARCLAECR